MPSDAELLALLNRRAAGEHEAFGAAFDDPPAEPTPDAVQRDNEPDPDRPPLIPYVKQDRVPTILRGVDLLLAATLRLDPGQLVCLGGQLGSGRRAAYFEVRTGPGEETVAGHAIIVVEPLKKDQVILTKTREAANQRWAAVVADLIGGP